MTPKLRVGLVGYGKAGRVANVLSNDPRFDLRWIARRSTSESQFHPATNIPIIDIEQQMHHELKQQ